MSSGKTEDSSKQFNFDSFVQLYKQTETREFDEEYNDEEVIRWLGILRTIQETGINAKAASRLTQFITKIFDSDVQPIPLEEVEKLMHERGLVAPTENK